MTKLRVTPLLRATWHEMMACSAVSATAVRVGVRIGMYFNNNTAETFVGYERIAAESGISKRAVWGAVRELRDAHLLIVKRGGRSSNRYSMPVENVAKECEIRFEKSRKGLRYLPVNLAAGCEINPAEISQRAATFPEISQNPARNLAAGCDLTLFNSKKARGRAREDRAPVAERKMAFGDESAAGVWVKPGTSEFAAWFEYFTRMGAQAAGAMRACEIERKPFRVASPYPKAQRGAR